MDDTEKKTCDIIGAAFGWIGERVPGGLGTAMGLAGGGFGKACEAAHADDQKYKATRAKCFQIANTTGEKDLSKNKALQKCTLELAALSMTFTNGMYERNFIKMYLKKDVGEKTESWRKYDWMRTPEKPYREKQ